MINILPRVRVSVRVHVRGLHGDTINVIIIVMNTASSHSSDCNRYMVSLLTLTVSITPVLLCGYCDVTTVLS